MNPASDRESGPDPAGGASRAAVEADASGAGRLSVRIAFAVLAALLVYQLAGTGLHSDDYVHVATVPDWSVPKLLTLDVEHHPTYFFYFPILYYDFIQFFAFGYQPFLYDLVKMATSFLCLLLIYRFAADHMPRPWALLFSFLFVFYPSHDATAYWTIGQYMMITPAVILYAHHLIGNGRHRLGAAFGLLGAFMSYASPPYMFGLALIFVLRKQWGKAGWFLLPQFIYIAYYIGMKRWLDLADYRTDQILQVGRIARQFLVQVFSFADAAIGPSFWLKIYYSFSELSLVSGVVGASLLFGVARYFPRPHLAFKKELPIAFCAVTLLALGQFALTGWYPQLAFNLGNRTTVFGAILMALLAVWAMSVHRHIAVVVFGVLLFSILGISDHWKAWNDRQMQVIEQVGENERLASLDPDAPLFVTGSQYSRFGKLSHIEFFSESWVVKYVFKVAGLDLTDVGTLNRRFSVEGSRLLDDKYGTGRTLPAEVWIYESDRDRVFRQEAADLSGYISGLPQEKRHWIQLLEGDHWIRRLLLRLMPRLAYAF